MDKSLEKVKQAEEKADKIVEKAKKDAEKIIQKGKDEFDKNMNNIDKLLSKERDQAFDKQSSKLDTEKELILASTEKESNSISIKAKKNMDKAVKLVVNEITKSYQ